MGKLEALLTPFATGASYLMYLAFISVGSYLIVTNFFDSSLLIDEDKIYTSFEMFKLGTLTLTTG